MKRGIGIAVAAGLLLLAACTNYNQALTGTLVTSIKSRVFVSNQLATSGAASGNIIIIDGTKDQVGIASSSLTATGSVVGTPASIVVGGVPTMMLLSTDKKTTLIFDVQTGSFATIDNATEGVTASIAMGGVVTSAVVLGDNKTGYAAVRNSGLVEVFDYTTFAVTKTLTVPTVHTLILSHNGNKILALSDDSNFVSMIDVAGNTVTTINSPSFDRPVYAVFSSDDSKAYIMSCGPECGGTKAQVNVLDVTSGNVTGSVAVSAASVGYLDSSGNLYVAGTQGTAGKLDVVTVSSLTVSKSGVPISDGFHTLIVPASNNRLFIGARTCNNTASGCLSIFNTSAGTAVIGGPKGDVTAVQPITGRNIAYVAEGGELRIYDTTKDAETNGLAAAPIDIVGKAWDIKAIDQ